MSTVCAIVAIFMIDLAVENPADRGAFSLLALAFTMAALTAHAARKARR